MAPAENQRSLCEQQRVSRSRSSVPWQPRAAGSGHCWGLPQPPRLRSVRSSAPFTPWRARSVYPSPWQRPRPQDPLSRRRSCPRSALSAGAAGGRNRPGSGGGRRAPASPGWSLGSALPRSALGMGVSHPTALMGAERNGDTVPSAQRV